EYAAGDDALAASGSKVGIAAAGANVWPAAPNVCAAGGVPIVAGFSGVSAFSGSSSKAMCFRLSNKPCLFVGIILPQQARTPILASWSLAIILPTASIWSSLSHFFASG